jgi:hypothetical protein
VTGRRERRRKQLLDGLEENRGCWKLKEEALDRTLWITRFGPVVRHYGMNERRRGQPQACFAMKYDIVPLREVCPQIFMFLDSH